MNYYIITKEVFESLSNGSIVFAHRSQDTNRWMVTTDDVIADVLVTFNNTSELSVYSFDNHTDWTGDGEGIEEWEIEETEYLNGL